MAPACDLANQRTIATNRDGLCRAALRLPPHHRNDVALDGHLLLAEMWIWQQQHR
ncbi:hypothetical protein LNP25_23715 [Klebsiella variicola subsp. variicola]|nr:hypothetical protein [Klebsiella variicola subsp. variicola]